MCKRLVLDGLQWRCRVDDYLRDQLEVVRALDARCLPRNADGDYRMVPTPSFVKVCRLDTLDVDSTSMVPGMCMPREQVERYLKRPHAPKYLDPGSSKDHLTSTMFAQLVAVGAIGTTGAATDLVSAEIESSLAQRKSVSVGVYSDTTGRRPSWSSSSRRSSRPRRTSSKQPDSQQTQLW